MPDEYPTARKLLISNYDLPAGLPEPPGRIKIRHPWYPEGDSLLLTLLGRDSSGGGIVHDLVHTICAIVANNRFDGWLSKSQDNTAEKIEGRLLGPGTYFFHLPGPGKVEPELRDQASDQEAEVYQYPIVPTFRAWKFPNSPLPTAWTTVSPQFVDMTTSRCALTDTDYSLDKAHVVPVSETKWFHRNSLQWYGQNRDSILGSTSMRSLQDPGNIITLRTDLHRAWDEKRFTFVPKQFSEGGEYRMVAHSFDSQGVFSRQYHNMLPHVSIDSKPREFFLARLAWTILTNGLAGFLLMGVPRRLFVTEEDGTIVERLVQPAECYQIAFTRPQSESPRKRKADDKTAPSVGQAKSSYGFDSGFGASTDDDDYYYDDDYDDDEGEEEELEADRGRKRRRETSPFWVASF